MTASVGVKREAVGAQAVAKYPEQPDRSPSHAPLWRGQIRVEQPLVIFEEVLLGDRRQRSAAALVCPVQQLLHIGRVGTIR
jgi:hypothetical protein